MVKTKKTKENLKNKELDSYMKDSLDKINKGLPYEPIYTGLIIEKDKLKEVDKPKDSYWVKLDSNITEDRKIMKLIDDMTPNGLGIYIILLMHLRNEKDYKSNIDVLSSLARRNNSTREDLLKVISDYDLFVTDGDCFYSEALIKRMQPLNEKRARLREIGRKGGLAKSYFYEPVLNADGIVVTKKEQFEQCISDYNKLDRSQIPSNTLILLDSIYTQYVIKELLLSKKQMETFINLVKVASDRILKNNAQGYHD